MRPFPGSDTLPRIACLGDGTTDSFGSSPTPAQITYVLADEAAVEVSTPQQSPSSFRVRDHGKLAHSSPNGLAGLGQDSNICYSPQLDDRRAGLHSASTSSLNSNTSRSPVPPLASRIMTPLMLGVSGPSSAVSSGSSRRNSLTGSFSEYPESYIMSVAEDSDQGKSQEPSTAYGTPQLIMPTITVPSRRPFTDVGKSLGRLKVLIAGNSGLGKTSLLRAIVQSCEHIVHVDPIASTQTLAPSLYGPNSKLKARQLRQATLQISEIYASTKPYPPWWTESDHPDPVMRRKNVENGVLDRNICLVDTPGYQMSSNATDVISRTTQYIESHLRKNIMHTLTDSELLNTLVGSGGLLVDAVLYMISSTGLTSTDLQFLRQLETLTNVIPLLAHADALSSETITSSKEIIAQELKQAGINIFAFADVDPKYTAAPLVYAVSTATASDPDVMDASLLMGSDYLQPLVPTDLTCLLRKMFCQDGSSWLRHSAARKLLKWRKVHGREIHAFSTRPLGAFSASPSYEEVVAPSFGATTSLAVACLADHTHREERLAQIRLANWAADLQRSLANERAHYEKLAMEQRSVWLEEKLREHTRSTCDMTLTRLHGQRRKVCSDGILRHDSKQSLSCRSLPHQDPLGLLQLGSCLNRKGWYAFEVVGSLGILGSFAVWLLV